MTLTAELSRIEAMISRLSYSERLWLIERLVHQMREESGSDQPFPTLSAEDQLESIERGARLLQFSKQQQTQWAAGMAKVMEELGISGEPIGAEKVQEMIAACGVKPEDSEFSRGIIEMREE